MYVLHLCLKEQRVQDAVETPIGKKYCSSSFVCKRRSRFDRVPTNCKLTDAQEDALENYIKRLDATGTSATLRMVKSSANFLLKNANDDPETPIGGMMCGKLWKWKRACGTWVLDGYSPVKMVFGKQDG